MFAAFDRPVTNQSCSRRNETTIAPQALHLLNSNLVQTCAEALAVRVSRQCQGNMEASVKRAFLLALTRPPTSEERIVAQKFLAAGSSESLVNRCLALFNLKEFIYID